MQINQPTFPRILFVSVFTLNYTSKNCPAQPNRDHVFYVTVPDHWKHPNIVQQFRNYGNVFSAWMTTPSNSCYVALQQREHASVVMKTIKLAEGVTIMPFAEYQAKRNKKTLLPTTMPPQQQLPNLHTPLATATTVRTSFEHTSMSYNVL